MPSLLASRLALTFAFAGFAAAAGCATTATVSRLRPAEAPILGVKRVAVLPLQGPGEPTPAAQQALLEIIRETGRFEVIPPDQLQAAAPGPLVRPGGAIDRRVALDAARRLAADAILIGDLEVAEEGWADMGGVRVILGDPTVRAVCHVQLVDVRSGQMLFKGSDEQTWRGEFSSAQASSTSRPRVYERLARQCTAAAARRIAPHQISTDVVLPQSLLGKGSGALRRGNSLAREGRWDEAQQQWLAALSENPQNDAAAYSVGLAHEARGDFPLAEQRYHEALEIADRALYREAIERVRQASQEHQLASNQLAVTRPLPPVAFREYAPFEHPAGYEIPAAEPAAVPETARGLAPVGPPAAYESRLQHPLGPATFYR